MLASQLFPPHCTSLQLNLPNLVRDTELDSKR